MDFLIDGQISSFCPDQPEASGWSLVKAGHSSEKNDNLAVQY